MPTKEIEELKNSFIEHLAPVRIYLFGSFAEGRENENSDFDFYIIVKDTEKDILDLTSKAYKSIRHKQRRAVDIIVNTQSRFDIKKDRLYSVENEVLKKGVLLYG